MRIKKISMATSLMALVASSTVFADTVSETAISVTKEGIGGVGTFYSLKVGVIPRTINVGSSYVSILSTLGGIAQKVTNYAINKNTERKCKSTTGSFDYLQNICESAPNFELNKFCVVNIDNINKEDVRIELVNWQKTGELGDVIAVNNINDKTQSCIGRPLSATYLEIYNAAGEKIFSRPLPVNLFNGQYGGLVKNGKFYFKEKQNEFHHIMGYSLCPRIMYDSPGFESQDVLAGRCLDKIKEGDPYGDHKSYDRLFTKTMKDSNFDKLPDALPGVFNDKYIIKNSAVDMESSKYIAPIGGLFALTKDVYVYVDPSVNGGQKISPTEIKIWNNFNYTGHKVSSGNISGMTSSIPKSSLKLAIDSFNVF